VKGKPEIQLAKLAQARRSLTPISHLRQFLQVAHLLQKLSNLLSCFSPLHDGIKSRLSEH
jgi:hypothetical protein